MNEKNFAKMRKEFLANYKNKIVPKIKTFESERKKRLVLAIILSSLFSILGLFVIFLMYQSNQLSKDILGLAICLFIIAYLSWEFIKKSFEKKIKNLIMPVVCECFGNLSWSQGNYTNGELFPDSCLIKHYTHAYYDDIFNGNFRNINIEIIESCFKKITGSGKSRHEELIFDGVIIKTDMNKKFNSHTVIKPDKLFHQSPGAGLKHTTLEDVEFEKKYDVFTDDEVDARYLITPSFMERLNKMKTAFKADKVSCAFYNNYLLIALSTKKDLFSICSLTKPVTDRKQFIEMYDEIASILYLIDYFKLNQKIGL